MSLRNLLVSRADIESATESTDTKGRVTVTWGKVAIRLRCRFNALQGTERNEYQKAGRDTTHRIYFETRIPSGGGVVAGSATTVPDLIKGSQASQNPRHRIVATLAGTTRYFQIETPFDTDEIQKLTVIDAVEREDAWFNDA